MTGVQTCALPICFPVTIHFAVAFDPEFIRTPTMAATRMAYANFECSAFGPTWLPQEVDVTRFLDKSKWFQSEVNGSTSPNDVSGSLGVQGSFMLCPSADGVASQSYGMFSLIFELAMFELGPTEAFSSPTFLSQTKPTVTAAPVSVPATPPTSDRPMLVQTGESPTTATPLGYVLVKQQ